MENFEQLMEELELDQEQPKAVNTGEGIIAYRKYLWAIKYINERIDKLKDYKKQVVADIDLSIEKQNNNIARIKSEIEKAVLIDPVVTVTKTGGRSISLPDIATVSLSKLSEKIVIEDPDAVLEELGQEFAKVKVSLDAAKAKKHIKESGILPNGVVEKETRTLSIRFVR